MTQSQQTPTTTRPAEKPAAETFADFSAAVRDILTEHELTHHQSTGDVELLVEQITDAHAARMRQEREIITRQGQQIRHLWLRDQTLAAHMEQLHDGHVKTLVSRDRYGAQTRVLSAQLDRISALVRAAVEEGAIMISIPEIRAITDHPPHVPPQHPAVPLTVVANDTRWTHGLFDRSDGKSQLEPFIGWSVVARGTVMDALIEPVFRLNGRQFCQSQMAQQGLHLRQLQ